MTQRRFSYLDGLRGMAAIFILTRHTGQFWGYSFYRSYLAVDIFFVLSGFVIAYAYDNKMKSGQMSIKQFFLIRIKADYPD